MIRNEELLSMGRQTTLRPIMKKFVAINLIVTYDRMYRSIPENYCVILTIFTNESQRFLNNGSEERRNSLVSWYHPNSKASGKIRSTRRNRSYSSNRSLVSWKK